MDHDEILDKVKDAVSQNMDVEKDQLTGETTLDSLSADSLDKIELIVALEEEFATSVDDDVLSHISTLDDCVTVIEQAIS